ncbi:hypothetical protein EV673_0838 [Limnobacter thiooxidans]|nr:hypothetical protein EV673_0838 [Limnobacter thiooxidans]
MQTGSICLSLFVLLEKPAEGTQRDAFEHGY